MNASAEIRQYRGKLLTINEIVKEMKQRTATETDQKTVSKGEQMKIPDHRCWPGGMHRAVLCVEVEPCFA